MIINNKFSNNETVYIKTDREQLERMVVGILVYPEGISYKVNCGTVDSWHYAAELSAVPRRLETPVGFHS